MADRRPWVRVGLTLLVVLVLAACAAREQRSAGAWLDERESLFAAHPVWTVSGRVGLSDGQRGGSLSFEWQADGEAHEVHLRTMTGGKQWRLRFDQRTAYLEGSDVGELWGSEPDPLVEAAVGWPIPVRALSFWIRGLIPPEHEGRIFFAADGTLDRADSPPWHLEFQRFEHSDLALMPSRMQATSQNYRVRLVLRNWNLSSHTVTKSL
jgi:outer membrane lipoprotein LolB